MALLLSAARSPGGVAAPPNGHYNMNTYFFKGGRWLCRKGGGCDVKTEPEGQGTMCLGPLTLHAFDLLFDLQLPKLKDWLN